MAFVASIAAIYSLQSWFPASTAADAPFTLGPNAFPPDNFSVLDVASLGATTTVTAAGYGIATRRVWK